MVSIIVMLFDANEVLTSGSSGWRHSAGVVSGMLLGAPGILSSKDAVVVRNGRPIRAV